MKTIDETSQPAGGSVAADKVRWIAENLKEGELYAGLILGIDGEPDHHVILLPGAAEGVSWDTANDFAAKAGGELPTRREQALLYANLKHEFEPRWYWSSEQHAADADYAWFQEFGYGSQSNYGKSASLRARAVRRLIIQ
jgi:hypothetical protein